MSIFNKKQQGEQLKKLRKSLDLTQLAISEILNIEQGYYSELERGVKSLSYNMIENISNCFKTRKHQILNLNWLLLSIGEMGLPMPSEQSAVSEPRQEYLTTYDYEKEIIKLNAQIDILKEMIRNK